MNNDDVLDMRHLIRLADDDDKEGSETPMVEWKDYSTTTSALEMLQQLNHLDGKARRRIRRAQERKHKKK